MTQYLFLFLKGLAMGAADIVPGVSGGTIAFITGIYEELLASIRSINLKAIQIWRKEGFKAFWSQINGKFLLSLFGGVAVGIVSLAKIITYMLHHYPVLVWSFFLGLIIASSYIVFKQVKSWNFMVFIALLIGAGISVYITLAAPVQSPDNLWYVFFAGMIAICAMILPGISGSFILLLLGAYPLILGSLTSLITGFKTMSFPLIGENGLIIIVFMSGCVVGILSFSHILSWTFKRAYNITIALLAGFMIGSLNKVWPWKEVIEYRINSAGEEVPFLDQNVSPFQYQEITGMSPFVLEGLAACVLGFVFVFGLEKIGDMAKSGKKMRQFGLIGFPLTHSFSKKYFSEKFKKEKINDANYELYELDRIDKFPTLVDRLGEHLIGLNVTIPYKEQIIPYLSSLDPVAKKIAAVNVIKVQDKKLIGYNSDYFGFKTTLEKFLEGKKVKALVLGTGGASKAVCVALEDLNIPFHKVSRQKDADKGVLSYEDLDEDIIKGYKLIINTTPLGMHPKVNEKPDLLYKAIGKEHFLYDLVYNPVETAFMKAGQQQGAKVINGLSMLEAQAEKAWEIWNTKE